MTTDILPDSRLQRSDRGQVSRGGVWWEPIFCASCGTPGGLVPVENMTFAFYICTPCHERHGEVAGTYAMPDEVFAEKVRQHQIEKYGCVLDPPAIARALAGGDTALAKLAKDKPRCR